MNNEFNRNLLKMFKKKKYIKKYDKNSRTFLWREIKFKFNGNKLRINSNLTEVLI